MIKAKRAHYLARCFKFLEAIIVSLSENEHACYLFITLPTFFSKGRKTRNLSLTYVFLLFILAKIVSLPTWLRRGQRSHQR